MLNLKVLKAYVNWENIRAFLCTLAVSLSFNCTWRTPREGFRYGGLQFFIALTVANVFVALPLSFLHLALGQLSHEDVVGVWRVVPFFRGIGYLRLIVSYIGSICTTTYLTIIICYFLASATNPIFPECTNSTSYNENANVTEMFECLKKAFIEPEGAQEHFTAILIIIFIVTIVFTGILYWFSKLMKCILYVLGPVIIIMCIIIASGIGNWKGFDTFNIESNWRKLFEADIWHSALIQSLLSSQLSGGYLILSGSSLYPYSDNRRTALFIVGINIITSLAGLMFWFGISGENKDTSAYAVLIQAYYTVEENGYSKCYPMLISAMLILSGAISMLSFSYPSYEHMRRVSEKKWQYFCTLIAYLGIWITLSLTQFGLPGLSTIEYTVMPFIINFGLACEIFALIFFYGLKSLIRDCEFLTAQKLFYWPFGWWIALVFIIAIDIWWVAEVHLWLQSRWEVGGLIAATILTITIFFLVATISVQQKDELGIFEKFKSSLRPSKHWGPRNLLINLYWKTYCQKVEQEKPKSRSNRRRRGRTSFRRSNLSVIPEETSEEEEEVKIDINVVGRSNSDGVLYNGHRKDVMKRSMSLDMNVDRDVDLIRSFKDMADDTSNYLTSDESIVCVQRNIRVVAVIERHE